MLPLLSAPAHSPAIAGAIPLNKSATLLTASGAVTNVTGDAVNGTIDLRPVIDWSCHCLRPLAGEASIVVEVRTAPELGDGAPFVDRLELVSGAAGTGSVPVALYSTSLPRPEGEVDAEGFVAVRVPIVGRGNVWPSAAGRLGAEGDAPGLPPWGSALVRLHRSDDGEDGAAAAPQVRRIWYEAAASPSALAGMYLLDPGHSVRLRSVWPDNATLVPVQDDASSPPAVTVPSRWRDVASFDVGRNFGGFQPEATNPSTCFGSAWPGAPCSGTFLELEVARMGPSTVSATGAPVPILGAVYLFDSSGTVSSAILPDSVLSAQSDAAEGEWVTISLDLSATQRQVRPSGVVALRGDAAHGVAVREANSEPDPFDWSSVAGVGFARGVVGVEFGDEVGGLANDAVDVQVRRLRVARPPRLGWEGEWSDNYDDLNCNFGWHDASPLARNGPARYSHCRECCCFFDDPGSGPDYEKFCYDQGDILADVSPSEDLAPNDQCMACNRENNPQVISPRTTMFEPGEVVPCDDDEPCSYDDICTEVGFCAAVEYHTCLESRFHLGDPSKDCEECDGTGPHSPTRGCRAKKGFFVVGEGTDDRTCGCMIDGKLWAHQQVNPDAPCQVCNVVLSNTEWSMVPDDSACDPRLQADWEGTAAQFCTWRHSCLAGQCVGLPYSCPPLQPCEMVQDGFPHVCDLTGPASATGGCRRLKRPRGSVCAPQVHGCLPAAECIGTVGSCPNQLTLPGIIYQDNEKLLEPLMPDGGPLDPEIAVVPSVDAVLARYVAFRVQCDVLQLRMAIIDGGGSTCRATDVSDDVGNGWGAGFDPPPRAVMLLRADAVALAFTANQSEFAVRELRVADDNGDSDDGDEAGGATRLEHAAYSHDEVEPLNTTVVATASDLSAAVNPTCDCLADAHIEMDVFSMGSERVVGGRLVDATGRTVTFSLAGALVSGQWGTAVGALDADNTTDFDWTRVAGVVLVRTGPAQRAPERDGAVVAFVGNMRVRTHVSPPCAAAVVVDDEAPQSAPARLVDGRAARAEFVVAADGGAAVDVTGVFSADSGEFVDGVLGLRVRAVGARGAGADAYADATSTDSMRCWEPAELRLVGEDGDGLVVPLSLAAAGRADWRAGEWVRVAVALHEGMLSQPALGAETWARLTNLTVALARVSTGATCAAGTAIEADGTVVDVEVRGVSIERVDFACSQFRRHTLPVAASGGVAAIAGASADDAVVLHPSADDPLLTMETATGFTGVVAAQRFQLDLAALFDEDTQTFPGAYLEIEAHFESPTCVIGEVEFMSGDGTGGLRVPVGAAWHVERGGMRFEAVDDDGAPLSGAGLNRARVALEAQHVLGVPDDGWSSIISMRFYRTGGAGDPGFLMGKSMVTSLSIRSYELPCDEATAVFAAPKGPPAPSAVVLDREVELVAADGRAGAAGMLVEAERSATAAARKGAVIRSLSAAEYGTTLSASLRLHAVAAVDDPRVGVAGAASSVQGGSYFSSGDGRRVGVVMVRSGPRDARSDVMWAAPMVGTALEPEAADEDAVHGVASSVDGRTVLVVGHMHNEAGAEGAFSVQGPTGDAVDVGLLADEGGGSDAFVAAFDAADGTALWLGGVATAEDDSFLGVAVTSEGVVAVGYVASAPAHAAGSALVGDASLAGSACVGLVLAFDTSVDATALRGSTRGSWVVAAGHASDPVCARFHAAVSVPSTGNEELVVAAGSFDGGDALAVGGSGGVTVSAAGAGGVAHVLVGLDATDGAVLWVAQPAQLGGVAVSDIANAGPDMLIAVGSLAAAAGEESTTTIPAEATAADALYTSSGGEDAVLIGLDARNGAAAWVVGLGAGDGSATTFDAVAYHSSQAVVAGTCSALLASAPGAEALCGGHNGPSNLLVTEWRIDGLRGASFLFGESADADASPVDVSVDGRGDAQVVGAAVGHVLLGAPHRAAVGPMLSWHANPYPDGIDDVAPLAAPWAFMAQVPSRPPARDAVDGLVVEMLSGSMQADERALATAAGQHVNVVVGEADAPDAVFDGMAISGAQQASVGVISVRQRSTGGVVAQGTVFGAGVQKSSCGSVAAATDGLSFVVACTVGVSGSSSVLAMGADVTPADVNTGDNVLLLGLNADAAVAWHVWAHDAAGAGLRAAGLAPPPAAWVRAAKQLPSGAVFASAASSGAGAGVFDVYTVSGGAATLWWSVVVGDNGAPATAAGAAVHGGVAYVAGSWSGGALHVPGVASGTTASLEEQPAQPQFGHFDAELQPANSAAQLAGVVLDAPPAAQRAGFVAAYSVRTGALRWATAVAVDGAGAGDATLSGVNVHAATGDVLVCGAAAAAAAGGAATLEINATLVALNTTTAAASVAAPALLLGVDAAESMWVSALNPFTGRPVWLSGLDGDDQTQLTGCAALSVADSAVFTASNARTHATHAPSLRARAANGVDGRVLCENTTANSTTTATRGVGLVTAWDLQTGAAIRTVFAGATHGTGQDGDAVLSALHFDEPAAALRNAGWSSGAVRFTDAWHAGDRATEDRACRDLEWPTRPVRATHGGAESTHATADADALTFAFSANMTVAALTVGSGGSRSTLSAASSRGVASSAAEPASGGAGVAFTFDCAAGDELVASVGMFVGRVAFSAAPTPAGGSMVAVGAANAGADAAGFDGFVTLHRKRALQGAGVVAVASADPSSGEPSSVQHDALYGVAPLRDASGAVQDTFVVVGHVDSGSASEATVDVAGQLVATVGGVDTLAFAAQLDADGDVAVVWAQTLGAVAEEDGAYAVASGAGFLIVGGYAGVSGGGDASAATVSRVDNDGAVEWHDSFGTLNGDGHARTLAVAVERHPVGTVGAASPEARVAVAGYFQGGGGLVLRDDAFLPDDHDAEGSLVAFVALLSADTGELLWARATGDSSTASSFFVTRGVALSAGHVLAVGEFRGNGVRFSTAFGAAAGAGGGAGAAVRHPKEAQAREACAANERGVCGFAVAFDAATGAEAWGHVPVVHAPVDGPGTRATAATVAPRADVAGDQEFAVAWAVAGAVSLAGERIAADAGAPRQYRGILSSHGAVDGALRHVELLGSPGSGHVHPYGIDASAGVAGSRGDAVAVAGFRVGSFAFASGGAGAAASRGASLGAPPLALPGSGAAGVDGALPFVALTDAGATDRAARSAGSAHAVHLVGIVRQEAGAADALLPADTLPQVPDLSVAEGARTRLVGASLARARWALAGPHFREVGPLAVDRSEDRPGEDASRDGLLVAADRRSGDVLWAARLRGMAEEARPPSSPDFDAHEYRDHDDRVLHVSASADGTMLCVAGHIATNATAATVAPVDVLGAPVTPMGHEDGVVACFDDDATAGAGAGAAATPGTDAAHRPPAAAWVRLVATPETDSVRAVHVGAAVVAAVGITRSSPSFGADGEPMPMPGLSGESFGAAAAAGFGFLEEDSFGAASRPTACFLALYDRRTGAERAARMFGDDADGTHCVPRAVVAAADDTLVWIAGVYKGGALKLPTRYAWNNEFDVELPHPGGGDGGDDDEWNDVWAPFLVRYNLRSGVFDFAAAGDTADAAPPTLASSDTRDDAVGRVAGVTLADDGRSLYLSGSYATQSIDFVQTDALVGEVGAHVFLNRRTEAVQPATPAVDACFVLAVDDASGDAPAIRAAQTLGTPGAGVRSCSGPSPAAGGGVHLAVGVQRGQLVSGGGDDGAAVGEPGVTHPRGGADGEAFAAVVQLDAESLDLVDAEALFDPAVPGAGQQAFVVPYSVAVTAPSGARGTAPRVVSVGLFARRAAAAPALSSMQFGTQPEGHGVVTMPLAARPSSAARNAALESVSDVGVFVAAFEPALDSRVPLPGGSLTPVAVDLTAFQSGDCDGCVRGYTLQLDVRVGSARHVLGGGSWTSHDGAHGFSFELSAAQQRREGAWLTLEADVVAHNAIGKAASRPGGLSSMGAFSLFRVSVDEHGDARRGGAVPEEDVQRATWQVRNARLLRRPDDTDALSRCTPCGRIDLTGDRAVQLAPASAGVGGARAWAERGEANLLAPARSVGAAVDVTRLVDASCACLRGASVVVEVARPRAAEFTVRSVATDADWEAVPAALAGAWLATGDDHGPPGVFATGTFAAGARVDGGDSDGGVDGDEWSEFRLPLAASDHVDALGGEWSRVKSVALLAGDGVDGALRVRRLRLERPCPPSPVVFHPNPTRRNTTLNIGRGALGLTSGTRYRVITYESNTWGDASSATCSEPFIVDDSPPDVSAVELLDIAMVEGAEHADIDGTPHGAFRVGWTGDFLEPHSAPDNTLLFRISNVTRVDDGTAASGVFESEELRLATVSSGYVETTNTANLTLEDGVAYAVHLSVCNRGRLCSVAATDGVVVDRSPPLNPPEEMRDVTPGDAGGGDIDHTTHTTLLRAEWRVFDEPHTALGRVLIGLGTAEFGADVHALRDVALTDTSVEWAPPEGEAAFLEGEIYYTVFRVFNSVGAWADYRTDGVIVDTSAPEFTYVVDVLSVEPVGAETNYGTFDSLGDVDEHDGAGFVRAKFRCDDPQSVGAQVDGVGERGLMSYRWRVCATVECAGPDDVVVDWMDAGTTPRGTTPQPLSASLDSPLGAGTALYVHVECSNPVGLVATGVSDGVVVETSAPLTGNAVVADVNPGAEALGSLADVAYHDSGVLRAAWSGFEAADGAAPIAFYEVGVGVAGGALDGVLGFFWVGLVDVATTPDGAFEVVPGVQYLVTVRATSANGAQVTVTSDGVVVDHTGPVNGTVADALPLALGSGEAGEADACPGLECRALQGADDDVQFMAQRETFSAVLGGARDAETDIVDLWWGVSTCDASMDLNTVPRVEVELAGGSGSLPVRLFADGLQLVHGLMYCAVAAPVNAAGADTPFVSDGVVVDLTPPEVDFVHDGGSEVLDVDVWGAADELRVTHHCRDPESGVHHFEVRVLRLPEGDGDATVVSDWTDWAPGTTASNVTVRFEPGSELQQLGRYVVTTRCFNRAGVYVDRTSDGFVVDLTPPVVDGALIRHARHGDEQSVQVHFSADTHVLVASWRGVLDAESRVTSFEWSVDGAGGGVVVPRTSVGAATQGRAEGLNLVDGETYFVTVFATNAVGHTASFTSTGLTVDASGPVYGTVTVDPGSSERGYLATTDTLTATWDGLSDPHTSVAFEWAIGTSPFGQQELAFTQVDAAAGAARTATATGLGLTPGGTYYVSVLGTNDAGLQASRMSAPVYVDPFPPTAGAVFDGIVPEASAAFSTATDSLRCSWRGFEDALSGVFEFHVGFGTAPLIADTSGGLAPLGGGFASHLLEGLALEEGVRYHCLVHAVDFAGNSAEASSPGVVVDASPPVAGVVLDGRAPGVDVDVQRDATRLSVTWEPDAATGAVWGDPHSGFSRFEWAAGTSPGGDNVVAWTSVAPHLRATSKGGLSLEVGQRYYATVRAFNPLGMASEEVSSDGVLVMEASHTVSTSPVALVAAVAWLQGRPDVDAVTPRDAVAALPWAPRGATGCVCDAPGSTFVPATGACSCVAEHYLDVQTGACSPCPSGTCKRRAGNALSLCTAEACAAADGESADGEGGSDNNNRDGGGMCSPLQGSDGAAVAPHDGAFADAGAVVSPTTAGATCVCPVGARYWAGPPALCVACDAGDYADAAGLHGACRSCAAPDVPDVVLRVQWDAALLAGAVAGADDEPEESGAGAEPAVLTHVVVSVGHNAGALRWVRTVAPDAAVVEFVASGDADGDGTFDAPATASGGGDPPFRQGDVMHARLRAYSGDTVVFEAATAATTPRLSVESGVVEAVVAPLDFTPPTAGSVLDGDRLADADVLASGDVFEASWHSFSDAESGVRAYRVAFGTEPGASDVSDGYFDVDGDAEGTSFDRAAAGLPAVADGTRVFATVVALGGVDGARAAVASDGAVVQSTLSEGTVVIRGDTGLRPDATPFPHRHAAGQSSRSVVAAAWLFEAAPGVALAYEWSVRGAGGGDVVAGPFAVGGRSWGMVTGLELVEGEAYEVLVRATTAAGVARESVSPATLVDASRPSDGSVAVTPLYSHADHAARAAPADDDDGRRFQSDVSSLAVSWQFVEAETAIAEVRIAVGNVVGGDRSMPERVVPGATEAIGSVTLEAPEFIGRQGECYVAQVSLVNAAGLESAFAASAPVCVDATPPHVAVAFVPAALTMRLDFPDTGDSVVAGNATALDDGEAGDGESAAAAVDTAGADLAQHVFALADCAVAQAREWALSARGVLYQPAAQPHGQLGRVEADVAVEAWDVESGVTRAVVAVHDAETDAPIVAFGVGGDGWVNVTDVVSYDGDGVARPFLPSAERGRPDAGDAALLDTAGRRLRARVLAYNGAGIAGDASSGAVDMVVDVTPPSLQAIEVVAAAPGDHVAAGGGDGAAVDFVQSSVERLAVTWTVDEGESALAGVAWRVRALTRPALVAAVAAAAGDDAAAVDVGAWVDADVWVDEDVAADADGADAVALTWLGIADRAAVAGLALEHGGLYSVDVVACNAVGLCAARSVTVSVDASPPRGGVVVPGVVDAAAVASLCPTLDVAAAGTVAPTTACPVDEADDDSDDAAAAPAVRLDDLEALRLSWMGFDDSLSALVGYRIALGTSPGGSQLLHTGDVGGVAAAEAVEDAGTPVRAVYSATVGDAMAAAGVTLDDVAALLSGARNTFLYATVSAENALGAGAVAGATLAYIDAALPTPGAVAIAATEAAQAVVVAAVDEDGAPVPPVPGGFAQAGTQPGLVQRSASEVHVSWEAFDDDDALARYEVALWSVDDGVLAAPALEVPAAGESAGDAMEAVFDGLSLAHGAAYGAVVTGFDRSGNSVSAHAPRAVVVDATPPHAPTTGVNDGFLWASGVDEDCQPHGGLQPLSGVDTVDVKGEAAQDAAVTLLAAHWQPLVDPESGVAEVWAAFGTTRGGDDLVAFRKVDGKANALQVQVPRLAEGTVVFASVRAVNALGDWSEPASSDGIRMTCDPDSPTCEYDGLMLCLGAL